MLGNYGDDLTNFWGLMGLFSLFLGLAVTVAKGWVKYLFFGLAALSFFLAVFWQIVKVAAPNAAASIVEITNDPQSWFVVFILVVAILIFRPPKFGRASRLSEPSTSNEISVDLASLSAEFDAKNNQTWEFSKTIFDGLNRLESQTNAIEKKLYEAVTDRIVPIENTLRPQGGLLGTLLMAPEDSRFDQIISDIESLRKGIAGLGERIGSEAKRQEQAIGNIHRAIRAKLCKERLLEAHRVAEPLGRKLLAARPSDYSNNEDWRSDYEIWSEAISEIDDAFRGWDKTFNPYKSLTQSDYEGSTSGLPQDTNITHAVITLFQTVRLINGRYQTTIGSLIGYLDGKSWPFSAS